MAQFSEKQALIRAGEAVLVTQMTVGTADALGNDPALTVLANFVNGVRMALIDPVTARRLSDAAEYIVTGNPDGSTDDYFAQPTELAARALASLDAQTL